MASNVAEWKLVTGASLRRPASEQYPQVVLDGPPGMAILLIFSIASESLGMGDVWFEDDLQQTQFDLKFFFNSTIHPDALAIEITLGMQGDVICTQKKVN